MKTKIVFLIVFTWVNWGVGQAQALFAPVMGAKWTYIYQANSFNGFNGIESKTKGIIKAIYNKDTTINSLTYKLIDLNTDILDSLHIPTIQPNGSIKYRDTVILKKTLRKMFFREQNDSLWAAIDFIITEKLYFVFKSMPDSFSIDKLSSAKVFIDTIYFKDINGKKLKTWQGKSYSRLLIDGLNYDTCNLTFIERIGIVDDIIPYFAFNSHPASINKNRPWGLVCYEDKDIGLIKLINLDCDISNTVSTKNAALENRIECVYNSSESKVHFDLHDIDSQNWNLILIDLQSHILLDIPIKNSSGFVKIQDKLPTGICIVHFYNKINGNFYNKKIFIQ